MKYIKKTEVHSTVWREGDFIFKKQPKFLTDNEWYAIDLLSSTHIVPAAERIEDDLIKMEFIETDIFPPDDLMMWYPIILTTLRSHELRHGDLSRPHILFRNKRPIILDFSESRYMYDPRPDKRPEGDEYWLKKTLENYQ